MSIEQTLAQRSDSKCELCGSDASLTVYAIPEAQEQSEATSVLLCQTCRDQIGSDDALDVNHWRCLNDSMWSQEPAVQVMAWRMLKRLAGQGEVWATDLLDMLYLEPEQQALAEAGQNDAADGDQDAPTLDSNGTPLAAGDTVTLIKDLQVKGAGFTAKRGTAVRNISLTGNPEQIEGKVNGVQIVLLTQFLKKA